MTLSTLRLFILSILIPFTQLSAQVQEDSYYELSPYLRGRYQLLQNNPQIGAEIYDVFIMLENPALVGQLATVTDGYVHAQLDFSTVLHLVKIGLCKFVWSNQDQVSFQTLIQKSDENFRLKLFSPQQNEIKKVRIQFALKETLIVRTRLNQWLDTHQHLVEIEEDQNNNQDPAVVELTLSRSQEQTEAWIFLGLLAIEELSQIRWVK